MKIISITDMHGETWRYKMLLKIAKQEKPDLIINCGDMLPFGNDMAIQGKFIKYALREHFEAINKEKIYYAFIPGNEDLKMYDDELKDIIKDLAYIKYVDNNLTEIDGHEILGLSVCPDFPFKIKDRMRRDKDNFKSPEQMDPPEISTKENGLVKIASSQEYIDSLPTIEEELKSLAKPKNANNSIYVIHAPPSKIGLDACGEMYYAGSDAVYDFICLNQPLLTLHGHIHESPWVSGKWFGKIGNTLCIQPGRSDSFIYVKIDTATMKYERIEM